MINLTLISARGRSRDGTAVLAYLREGELKLEVPATAGVLHYYADQSEAPATTTWSSSRWLGKGAEALGLTVGGPVAEKDMEQLAHGFDPKSGAKLSRTAGKEPVFVPQVDAAGQPVLTKRGQPKGEWRGGHRVGTDLTFNIAPKSVSLAYAAADASERIAISEAMTAAVAETLTYVEALVETGRGAQGTQKIGMSGLAVSAFQHLSNRELEPDLHIHALAYGVGQGSDGKWGSWETGLVYENQKTIGAVARCAFARNLSRLGYGIEKKAELNPRGEPTGEVYFEMTGVSKEQVQAFSTRRAKILEHVEKHGGTKQQAALATRRGKEEPSFDVVDALWRETLDASRAQDPTFFRDTADLKARPSRLAGVSDEALLRTLQQSNAVWGKEDLIGQLARENVGLMDVQTILKEADSFLERMAPQLVAIAPERSPELRHQGEQPSKKFTATRYSAQWWVDDVEQGLVDGAKARQHEPEQAVDTSTVQAQVDAFQKARGFSLSAEQRAAVNHLTSGQGLALLTGRAGTGKTTIAEVATKAWEATGRRVVGCSPSWDAAQKLSSETGMLEAYSLAKLIHDLDKGTQKMDARTVIVLDEAGMVDTMALRRIQDHVDRSGGKLVMMGDSWQLAPVQAGQGFRLLQQAVGDVQLTEIRRQRAQEDVATAQTFYTHSDRSRGETTRDERMSVGAQILERLRSRGQVEVTETVSEAIAELADDYLASPLPDRQKLALASTRADVRRLNDAIRDRLHDAGQLGEDHTLALTQQGQRVDTPVAVGDRLRFGKRDAKMGVVNGSLGVVEGIDVGEAGQATLTVRLESDHPKQDGRVLTFATKDYAELSGAWARTIHRSQGQTVEQAFYLANAGTDTHLSMVAFTRQRDQFRMYATGQDLEGLSERLGLDRLKANALEEGRAKPTVAPLSALDRFRVRIAELDQAARDQIERLRQAIVARQHAPNLKPKPRLTIGLE